VPSCSLTVRTGGGGGYSRARSVVYFLNVLTFTVSSIVISAGNSNSTVFGPRNFVILQGLAHGCCSFHLEGSWFAFVMGRSLVLNIMKSPTSRVHGLRLLFASAVWLSCASPMRSWASCNEPCNRSMNTAPSRLRVLSCCCWPATKSNGIDGVYPRPN
jgi:hypothetical protein